MKKYLFLIILVLSFNSAFACHCGVTELVNQVSISDFVATAHVTKVTPNKENPKVYSDLEINIISLYKGDHLSSLKVQSLSNTSCSLIIKENSTWLILAKKDKNGHLSFNFCSNSRQIDPVSENSKESLERKIELLDYIKSKNIQVNNPFNLEVSVLNKPFDEFRGIQLPNKEFALYELKINKDLSVESIKQVKGFHTKDIDEKIINIIGQNLKVYTPKRDDKIKEETKLIFALYYYSDEKYESFFSYLDL